MAAPNPILILPFVLLLGAMALAPLLAPRWWLKHYAKVALGLGAITAGIYLFILHDTASLGQAAHEYFSFIVFIGALFVVAGGIHINVKAEATPLANVIFLLTGAVAANFFGTTGAAMLLIRPWLRMNQPRFAAHHTVFFIFLVANIGGCLTPIGDPPLFLGLLQGIPFWWVAQHCWPAWTVAVGLLLAIFFVLDTLHFRGTPRTAHAVTQTWKFDGLPNLFFLMAILGAVFLKQPPFLRETVMLASAAAAYFTTKKSIHAANEFSFHPVIEVAVLFAGIFATMIPALAWLDHHAELLLGKNPGPGIFYWGAGGLSTVLDNAPTYLGFFSALHGVAGTRETAELLAQKNAQLVAISVGAVFFGAATYIGNGPNFMVKAIVEHRGLRGPKFLEFIWRFSLPYLLPVLITVWLLFFRG